MEDKNLKLEIEWFIKENSMPEIEGIKLDTLTGSERDSLDLNTIVLILALVRLVKASIAIIPDDEKEHHLDSINTLWRGMLIEFGLQEQPEATALRASIELIDGLMTVGGYTESQLGELSRRALWEAVRDTADKYMMEAEERNKDQGEPNDKNTKLN